MTQIQMYFKTSLATLTRLVKGLDSNLEKNPLSLKNFTVLGIYYRQFVTVRPAKKCKVGIAPKTVPITQIPSSMARSNFCQEKPCRVTFTFKQSIKQTVIGRVMAHS